MDLIGLDVGFSATRRSSGVARLVRGDLRLGRANSAWSSRVEIVGRPDRSGIAAIDAPVLPEMHWEPRSCERLFTFGAFQRRCKPGLSHVNGTGRQLRQAGFDSAGQVSPMVPSGNLKTRFPQVWANSSLVEAFPNAFLGVLVPEKRYDEMPRLRRGTKFDWLYDQCLELDAFKTPSMGIDPTGTILRECHNCNDHEERAALVCLLTAGEVALGRYTAIGEQDGGYFFLPRLANWATWARRELDKQRGRLQSVEVWVDGKMFSNSQLLPELA